MRAHLQENINLYGEQSLVNLVNHKGHERPVKEAFEKYMAEVNFDTFIHSIHASDENLGQHAEDQVRVLRLP